MKKIISVLLSACMTASCLSVGAVSAGAAVEKAEPVGAAVTESVGSGNQFAQTNIRGGAVLHCFDWSYSTIEENLEDIAAAGYTAVQTSPVQQPKDYSASWTSTTGQWWKMYQPLGLSIAPDNSSWIGNADDLASLCEAADEYGIKVIVDIVANHVANKGSDGGGYSNVNTAVEADLQDSAYYHSSNTGVNYDSRYAITQYHLGMPDLNTANSYVQQKTLQLLKDCVDLGVDGFRFDAAKHIETPNDDSTFASSFWSTVANGIKSYKSDVYMYGEILGDAGPSFGISNYTQYIDVTDDATGNDATAAVRSNSASDLADPNYLKGAGASHSVLWAESHDTYMHSETSDLTEAQITKIWGITGARANSTSLFLARPGSVMGAVGTDETWKSTAVSEINKFKNFFNGTSEYLSSSGKVAYCERGTTGVSIVNLNGAGSVSLTAHTMASGTYYDQITGNKFTVSNGVISGTVGSTGVAVVYNPSQVIPTTTPVVTDYYLFGWINGANYACEGDSANMGIYKFNSNGTLTTSFAQDSYVAVKEADNANWYMTDGWLGTSATSATLYNTSIVGSSANKLYVPGGVQVTFTLVNNGDGTFTLSYTTAGGTTTAPVTTAPVTTAPVTTAPVTTAPVTTAPVTTAPVTTAPVTTAPATTVPVTTAPVTTAPVTTAPVTTAPATTVPVTTAPIYPYSMYVNASAVSAKTNASNCFAWTWNTNQEGEWVSVQSNGYVATKENVLFAFFNTGTPSWGQQDAQTIDFDVTAHNGKTLTLNTQTDSQGKYKGEWEVITTTAPVTTAPVTTVPVTKTYYLFGWINGANYACEEDAANMGTYKFVNGTLTTSFAQDSYVAVKEDNNANWYMTDGWLGTSATSATLYNTSIVGNSANKLYVPGGVQVTFTLVNNGDGTFTLSYTTAGGTTTAPVTTAPVTTAPVTTAPVTTAPVTKTYYLFGWINGADYACEGDAANMGIYKFVNGTLTATFTQDSYVAVKEEGNVTWYMSNGYPGDTATSADLYSTEYTGENSEKLHVPGGVQVTFTLTDYENGSLTLSYTTGGEEITTVEPTTVEPTTVEPTTVPPVPGEDVCVVGTEDTDFVLKLDSVGESRYAGEMALPAGTYTFRMREGDQMLGYKGTITDAGNKANSFTFNPSYTSSTTLNTNGGVFYFWYHKELNKFYMYRVEDLVDNYLVGDLNTVMRPVPGQNSAVGSMHLEAGTYKFRVSIRGVINGYSATVNDSTNGASLTFENKWKAEITLNATGGTYSFYIINNTDTHKDYFQVKYIPDDPNQSKEDVHLTGDLSNILDDNNGEDEEAVAVVTLDANAYSFKVVDHGVDYTAGLTITEEGTKTLSSLYTRTVTFISVAGGTYEFRYNKTAHTLTITPVSG